MDAKFILMVVLSMFWIPLIQADTTFFDNQNDFFIMINHSFLQSGLSGRGPTAIIPEPEPPEEPEIIIESKQVISPRDRVFRFMFFGILGFIAIKFCLSMFIYPFLKRRDEKRKKERQKGL